jgi:hypothetical protein
MRRVKIKPMFRPGKCDAVNSYRNAAAWLVLGGVLLVGPALHAQGPVPSGVPGGYPTGPIQTNNGVGPGALPQGPTPPMQNERPSGWPGSPQKPVAEIANLPQRSPQQPPSADPSKPKLFPDSAKYQNTDPIARVGSEVILAGDLLPSINQRVAQVLADGRAKGQPDPDPEMIDSWREQSMRNQLTGMIDSKILFLEAKRSMPAEMFKKLDEHVTKAFRTEKVPQMVEQMQAESVTDLEVKLRQFGTSIEARRQVFIEQNAASYWLQQQVKGDKEITYEMMLKYYREHSALWEISAKVSWEHIFCSFRKHNDDKTLAGQLIAGWGNELLQGKSFAEVAKTHSDDISSEDGGKEKLTSKGALISVVLDNALFTLPVGTLSQILQDEQGLHIVRVLERKDARKIPFNEVQAEIKKKIRDEEADDEMKHYLDKLRSQTMIWTVFDGK